MNTLENFAEALRDAAQTADVGLLDAHSPSLARRFAVHRNNRALGLIGALEDSFPVTCQLLGKDCFHAITRDFIDAQPPTSPTLFEYGGTLPSFLDGLAALSAYPYLADVAQLEYHRVQAWHAADAAPLGPGAFAPCLTKPRSLPGLQLSLLPSSRLLRSNWATGSIWQSHQGTTPMQGFSLNRAESVLVHRPDDVVTVHIVSESCAALLEQLLAGERLAEAIASATHATPRFDLGEAFASLISLRCIGAITPPDEVHP